MHAGFAGAARKTGAIIAAAMLLGGCLSSGTEEEAADTGSFGDRELSGSVGDGPVVNADMRVMSRSGELMAEFQSDTQGGYNVTIRARDSQYPLTLDATGGTDLVTGLAPDFVLRGAAWSSSDRVVANVNPFSTFAFEIARDLDGGLSGDNFQTAEDIVVAALNAGLSTLVSSGPMTTRIDSSNVAEIVKASETLAETVRRTADALSAAGFGRSADQIVQALGSDLTDEAIEGGGGPRADARIAAVAIVTHAQVLLEAMANELHVNGFDATDAMRAAIDEVSPSDPSPTLEELTVTAAMLAKARLGIAAAFAVTDDPAVQSLGDSVDGIRAGMEWTLVRSLLPVDYRSRLDAAIAQIASGNAATLATGNDVARDASGGTPPPNRPPTLSGTPATSAAPGNTYSFSPAANDPDGDTLSFSISGRPSWANFDTTSGRLSGTPDDGDVGTYSGIVISASDGELTTSLPAFAIAVEASSNSAPTLSGTPPSSVTAGSPYSFTPVANDADGDLLGFDVSNLPSWADFNTGNGRISGTPNAADVGLYDNIRITVSDESASDTLGPFSIEVVAPGAASGAAILSWNAPTENEDGTPLTDLAGYRLYWGTTPGSYPNSVTIDNPGVTVYVVDNLAPGTYEFVATAFNTSGLESSFSAPTTKTVMP